MQRIGLLVSVVLRLGIATPVAASGGGRYPSERLPLADFTTERSIEANLYPEPSDARLN